MAFNKDEFLRLRREEMSRAVISEGDSRTDALEDLRFVKGGKDQWDDDAQKARQGRPMLTINKCPKFIRQVTGDQRQNRPAIKVRPVDSNADPEIAKILEGHIKNIEYNSQAPYAYDNAFKQAVAGGHPGWWRVTTDYADDDTFDQDILIDPIHNQFTVYADPDTIADVYRGNLRWAFVVETMSNAAFKEQYPKEDGGEWESGSGEGFEGWYQDNSTRVAEYFWREQDKAKTIYQVEGGEVHEAEKVKMFVRTLGDGSKAIVSPDGTSIIPITRERKVNGWKVKWCKITGGDIIEGPKDWAGRYIPLVPVFGDTWNIEGKTIYKSLIRDAKDPQRMYNYMTSQNVEMTALAPKVPFKVTPKQIEGYEAQWNSINNTALPYILYNPDPLVQGAPQREQGVAANSGYVQLALQATDDMKDTTGIYDASLGQRSNEQSGRAIMARQREGDISTFEFIDNLTRAIQYTGKILVDLIPRIYDAERTIRVLGADDTPQQVAINKTVVDETGEEVIINDITMGKYDVYVTVGPSFTTQRMENVEALNGILAAAPTVAPVILPRWAKYMDWPDAQEFADELREFLAPQPQGPQTPPISASVAIDLAALRPDVADALIAKVLESGQIKANFKEQATPATDIQGMLGGMEQPQQIEQPMPPMGAPGGMMPQEGEIY